MSWIEDIQKDIVITTGDGSIFSPDYLNTTKEKSFNVVEYDFPNTDGTLIIRRRPRSIAYNLELYFQGDDHLVESDRFNLATEDPRPWVISHPYYGILTVQPSRLTFDNTKYNITKVTGTVKETIPEEGVAVGQSDSQAVIASNSAMQLATANDFALVEVSAGDQSLMLQNVDETADLYKKESSEGVLDKLNAAKTAIENVTSDGFTAMQKVQSLIELPFQFERSVTQRVGLFIERFNSLTNMIFNTFFDRKYYESQGSTIIGSICIASITNATYTTRTEVNDQSERIISVYNTFLTKLNDLQNVDGYFPSAVTITNLEQLVRFTSNQLAVIALNTQQERFYTVRENTNLVALAHKLYGLSSTEDNVQRLKIDNSIGLNEILQIKKGRVVKYFVG